MRHLGLKCNFHVIFKCTHPHVPILLCTNFVCHLVAKAIFHALIHKAQCTTQHLYKLFFIGTLIRMCMVINSTVTCVYYCVEYCNKYHRCYGFFITIHTVKIFMRVRNVCEFVKMGLLINLCDFCLCVLALYAW